MSLRFCLCLFLCLTCSVRFISFLFGLPLFGSVWLGRRQYTHPFRPITGRRYKIQPEKKNIHTLARQPSSSTYAHAPNQSQNRHNGTTKNHNTRKYHQRTELARKYTGTHYSFSPPTPLLRLPVTLATAAVCASLFPDDAHSKNLPTPPKGQHCQYTAVHLLIDTQSHRPVAQRLVCFWKNTKKGFPKYFFKKLKRKISTSSVEKPFVQV